MLRLRPTSIASTLVSLADVTAICNLGPCALPQHRGSGAAASVADGSQDGLTKKTGVVAKFDRKRTNKKTPSSCLRRLRNESMKHPRTPHPL